MPHGGQKAILKSSARFKWVSAGRRWRKTTMALHPSIESALHGKPILWGAPTIDQTRIGWEECHRAVCQVARFSKSERVVEFPSGGRIYFRTLDDPDNARGFTYAGAIIDEASLLKERSWYEVIRPTLSDTMGWALFIGTPKGHNWFWRESVAAGDRPDSAAWQVPTLGVRATTDNGLVRAPHPLENPTFPFAEAVTMFQSMPRRVFDQEFLAQFVEDGGSVFRNVRTNATAQHGTPDAHRGHRITFGVDWGQQNDFTVIKALCVTCRREVDSDRFNQISWTLQRGRLEAMAHKWRPQTIIAEHNSIGGPNIEELHKLSLPIRSFETTPASKPPLIQSLALAFEKNEIEIINDPVTINELEAYEERRNATTGRPSYSAPEGMHDDCVMSLAMAFYGMMNSQVQVF